MMADQLLYKNSGNQVLLDLLPAGHGRVLDCGCGPGDNARLLSAAGWTVSGITLDPDEKEVASQFCDAVYLANLEDGLPENLHGSFDVILMSHVLEHLARPDRLLSDIRSVMGARTILAVALPNVLNYRQRASFLRGRFTYSDTGVLDRTHLRFYTFGTGRELLERTGFEVIRAVPDGSIPLWRFRQLLGAALRDRLTQQLANRWPNLFAYQSLFLARAS